MTEHHSFNKIFNTDDVNMPVNIFNENFIKCLDQCAPVVTKEIKRPFHFGLMKNIEIIKKDVTYNKLKRDRTNVLLMEQYRHEKKQVKVFIQLGKKEYYLNKLTNNKITQLVGGKSLRK